MHAYYYRVVTEKWRRKEPLEASFENEKKLQKEWSSWRLEGRNGASNDVYTSAPLIIKLVTTS